MKSNQKGMDEEEREKMRQDAERSQDKFLGEFEALEEELEKEFPAEEEVGTRTNEKKEVQVKNGEHKCAVCGRDLTDGVYNFSIANYGKPLCMPHQDEERKYKHPVREEVEGVKAEDEEAVRLRNEIMRLVDELEMDHSEYRKRLQEQYGVQKIMGMKNEDKLNEIEYLKGLFTFIKVQQEAKELREKQPVEAEATIVEEEKEEIGEEAVTRAEPVIKEVKNEWEQRVVTDEGAFLFRFFDAEKGLLKCKNEANGTEYAIDITKSACECPDFQINKQKSELCKHLNAAIAAGYNVKELPKLPAVPERKSRERKSKKEELVTVEILDQEVDMLIQVPAEIIMSETEAVAKIKSILGDKPEKKNVIESYSGIEELSAHVVIAMAQATGVQYRPLMIEEETTQMSMGEIYMAIADEDQRRKYGNIAAMMPKVDVVTRCRITMLAGWKDRSGNMRIGMGTKEEYLTPHALADIAKRGAAFIRTMAETKAAKKAILNALPVTDDGILSMIKQVYGW